MRLLPPALAACFGQLGAALGVQFAQPRIDDRSLDEVGCRTAARARLALRGTQAIDRAGQVATRGEIWNATSGEPIPKGARVRVTGVERLTLVVRRD